jgi:pre-mRNA-processing factor SLU7
MSHATKDCLERPRAKGAKFTNKNIAADEKVEEIELHGFDSKRDRWVMPLCGRILLGL